MSDREEQDRLTAAVERASESNATAPPWFLVEDGEGAPFPQEVQDVIWRLTEAIRLTQEYIDLPAVPGWSWYDALAQYRPDLSFEPNAPAAPTERAGKRALCCNAHHFEGCADGDPGCCPQCPINPWPGVR